MGGPSNSLDRWVAASYSLSLGTETGKSVTSAYSSKAETAVYTCTVALSGNVALTSCNSLDVSLTSSLP